jgi:hypothetical protein
MHDLATVQTLQGAAHHLSLRCGLGTVRKIQDQTTTPHIQRVLELAAAKFHSRSTEVRLVDRSVMSLSCHRRSEGRRVGGRFLMPAWTCSCTCAIKVKLLKNSNLHWPPVQAGIEPIKHHALVVTHVLGQVTPSELRQHKSHRQEEKRKDEGGERGGAPSHYM